MPASRFGNYGPVASEAFDVTVDFASIPTLEATDMAVALAKAVPGDGFTVIPLGTWPVGITLPQGRCLVAGTVQLRVANVAAAAIDPASQLVRIIMHHVSP